MINHTLLCLLKKLPKILGKENEVVQSTKGLVEMIQRWTGATLSCWSQP